jgi:hypothetical protein
MIRGCSEWSSQPGFIASEKQLNKLLLAASTQVGSKFKPSSQLSKEGLSLENPPIYRLVFKQFSSNSY